MQRLLGRYSPILGGQKEEFAMGSFPDVMFVEILVLYEDLEGSKI